MKELILVLALQFSAEFNRPIDNLQYRTGDLDHFLVINKRPGNIYEIVIDESLAKTATMDQLRTIVYHASAKATGMDTTSERRHFMNPKCILRPYRKLKH